MNFIHVYSFLVHSGTFYWKNLFQTLIMGMRKTALAPGNFCVLFTWRKVNSYRRQTVHRVKVDPGVSELPLGNELSRDHVNRPLGPVHMNPVQ